MAKTLYFQKRCDPDTHFFRCGDCGEDFDSIHNIGTNVVFGQLLLAVVCEGCVPGVRRRIAELVPRSFPDCDDRGNLLGDF